MDSCNITAVEVKTITLMTTQSHRQRAKNETKQTLISEIVKFQTVREAQEVTL